MSPAPTLADLQAVHPFTTTEQLVRATVEQAADSGPVELLRFLSRFISWNAGFGAGVAGLASKIGRSRALFFDREEPLRALADRSMHVASFFFDAARDEYDDRATPHRDTHRTLAQAVLKGIIQRYSISHEAATEALRTPLWLVGLEDRTQVGYGHGTPDDLPSIFRAMGYHLGSEVLADQEFSLLDRTLRQRQPELVQHLLRTRVRVADQDHPAWYWVGIHSGHGGGVEMDHFDWAVQGVREAFRYTDPEDHDYLREQVLGGFADFARCHTELFGRING
jgi:hypothetical protein